MLYHEVLFLPIPRYLILPYNFTIFRLSYSEKFLVVFILTENCVCFMRYSFLPLTVIYSSNQESQFLGLYFLFLLDFH